MGHSLDAAIRCPALEGNSNSLDVDCYFAVTSVLVPAVQATQQLEPVANRNPFECHTAFPMIIDGMMFRKKKSLKLMLQYSANFIRIIPEKLDCEHRVWHERQWIVPSALTAPPKIRHRIVVHFVDRKVPYWEKRGWNPSPADHSPRIDPVRNREAGMKAAYVLIIVRLSID